MGRACETDKSPGGVLPDGKGELAASQGNCSRKSLPNEHAKVWDYYVTYWSFHTLTKASEVFVGTIMSWHPLPSFSHKSYWLVSDRNCHN